MSLLTAPKIALQQAISHHQRGRLKEAEQLYRVVLKTDPGHNDAGRNLLAAMFMSGRYEEMERTAQELVQDAPRFGVAWKGMGLAQLMQGKDAVHAFRMAAAYLPEDAESHENLGLALKRSGQLEAAADSMRRAIRLNAALVSAHVNLGNILLEAGKAEEAIAACRRALELKPDLPEAHNNLGKLLRDCGAMEEAFACFQRALQLRPDMPEALNNLGRLLKDAGRFDTASACFRQVLATRANDAEAHYNLATVLHDQGMSDAARAHLAQALVLAPDNALFRITQAVYLLPAIPASEEEAQAACDAFGRALDALGESKADLDASRLPLPVSLSSLRGNHVHLLSRFGDLTACPPEEAPARSGGRSKIRLAIVSRHFRRHSVWDIHIKGLLQHIDRSRFEVALYALDSLEDEETTRARALADIWRDARSIAGLAGWRAAFAEDRPDAVYYPELGTDPLSYRLAGCRLAPLQLAGWANPLTSGLAAIDCFLSGELLETANSHVHYRERLVRLPGTGCCTSPSTLAAESVPDIETLLSARAGTRFLVAQTPFKVGPSDDALFAEIAAQTGACTFILLAHPQFPWATEQLTSRIGQAFHRLGLDPDHHLLVLPWPSQEKFLSLLALCDVYLDCPSFSGYATARMAVQSGIPVVTLEGPALRQRLAAGLLKRIGADDTVCASKEAYVENAVQLARESADSQARNQRRARLMAAASLADGDMRVVRAFEQCVIDGLNQGSSPELAA